MSSIVQELQREAMSKASPITDLLRKALVVAKKLKIKEFEGWISHELNGYQGLDADQIPDYRKLSGTVKAFNPYHGWQDVLFESSKMMEALTQRKCHQSISEIEHMLDKEHGGFFTMNFSAEVTQRLMNSMEIDLVPALHVSPAAMNRILDSVRNLVLNWALKLEEDGILGDSISFSKQEVEKAAHSNYTINNFYGDVIDSQVQQGTTNSHQRREKSRG